MSHIVRLIVRLFMSFVCLMCLSFFDVLSLLQCRVSASTVKIMETVLKKIDRQVFCPELSVCASNTALRVIVLFVVSIVSIVSSLKSMKLLSNIGSNGETFANDCQLRLQSCRQGVNYFVRFPNSCETGRRTRDVQTAFLSQLSIWFNALLL